MKSLRLLSLTCALVLALLGTSTAQIKTGAFDEEKAATEDISKLVKIVKGDIKKALACTNVAYSEPLTALKFRQQVVAGMNYIVSVRVGGKVIHVKIYENLKGDVSLAGVVAEPGVEISDSADYRKCFIVS